MLAISMVSRYHRSTKWYILVPLKKMLPGYKIPLYQFCTSFVPVWYKKEGKRVSSFPSKVIALNQSRISISFPQQKGIGSPALTCWVLLQVTQYTSVS